MIHKQRSAFSMIMALAVIIIMSVIGAMVMNTSGKISSTTTMQYQREQAALLAKSYTEYAILAVTGNNRAVNCLRTVNGGINTAGANVGAGFRVRTHISYIADNGVAGIGNCAVIRVLFGAAGENITTTQTPLNIIVDVYVEYKEVDHMRGRRSPWHTYHRRTLQQI
jgi:type II secretory pathway pseudopilin PulG